MKRTGAIFFCVLGLLSCLLMFSGCGKEEGMEAVPEAENAEESYVPKIDISDLKWSVHEVTVDGKPMLMMDITNHSDYDLYKYQIVFSQKPDLTEDQINTFFDEIREFSGMDDSDLAVLQDYGIEMHSETEYTIAAGQTLSSTPCRYYTGYTDIYTPRHYELVVPGYAKIQYLDGDQLVTVTYDYREEQFTSEVEMESSYQWSETSVGDLIPKPDVKLLLCSFVHREDAFPFKAYFVSQETYDDFIAQCQEMGYTENNSTEAGEYKSLREDGAFLKITYDAEHEMMKCVVDAPDKK